MKYFENEHIGIGSEGTSVFCGLYEDRILVDLVDQDLVEDVGCRYRHTGAKLNWKIMNAVPRKHFAY